MAGVRVRALEAEQWPNSKKGWAAAFALSAGCSWTAQCLGRQGTGRGKAGGWSALRVLNPERRCSACLPAQGVCQVLR